MGLLLLTISQKKKSSFKMQELSFASKLDWGYYIVSKTAFKKIGALIHSMKFLSHEFVFISINLALDLAWNVWAGATSY